MFPPNYIRSIQPSALSPVDVAAVASAILANPQYKIITDAQGRTEIDKTGLSTVYQVNPTPTYPVKPGT